MTLSIAILFIVVAICLVMVIVVIKFLNDYSCEIEEDFETIYGRISEIEDAISEIKADISFLKMSNDIKSK